MKNFDEKAIKNLLQKENTTVPKVVKARIEKTLATLPSVERKKNSIWKKLMISSAAVVTFIAGSLFAFPTFADYVKSIFARSGDEGLAQAKKEVNYSVTDKAITLKVKELVVDRSRIAFSYTFQKENGEFITQNFSLDTSPNATYLRDKNGNRLDIGFIQKPVNNGGIFEFVNIPENIPSQMTLVIDIKGIGDPVTVRGNWKLEIPIDLTKSVNSGKQIPINEATTAGKFKITLNQLSITPSGSKVSLKIDASEQANIGMWFDNEYTITDKSGKVVAKKSSLGNSKNFISGNEGLDQKTKIYSSDDLFSTPLQSGEGYTFHFEKFEYVELINKKITLQHGQKPTSIQIDGQTIQIKSVETDSEGNTIVKIHFKNYHPYLFDFTNSIGVGQNYEKTFDEKTGILTFKILKELEDDKFNITTDKPFTMELVGIRKVQPVDWKIKFTL